MSRAFRQTLERIALLAVGLLLGCLLLGGSGQTLTEDEREASWIAGYRRGQADYQRALRKVDTLPAEPLAALPTEPAG
jgi:hypothetical protein